MCDECKTTPTNIITDSARKENRKQALSRYHKTRSNIGHGWSLITFFWVLISRVINKYAHCVAFACFWCFLCVFR